MRVECLRFGDFRERSLELEGGDGHYLTFAGAAVAAIGDDMLWGVVRHRKTAAHVLASEILVNSVGHSDSGRVR